MTTLDRVLFMVVGVLAVTSFGTGYAAALTDSLRLAHAAMVAGGFAAITLVVALVKLAINHGWITK